VGGKLNRAEALVIAAVSFFACTGVVGMLALDAPEPLRLIEPPLDPFPAFPGVEAPVDAIRWFDLVRPHCNSVEVDTRVRWQPAPPTPDGDMYKAACYALAGRMAQARETIESLPPGLRYAAAGVVFEAGHPAADAGDDIAAGPLMELVLEYAPRHYMALYHAGTARFQQGDYGPARKYLESFLVEYRVQDGWTLSATSMLERMSER
jgi:hypothetical protein